MTGQFIFDENGQICNDDPIYKKLDNWHDNDKFDKILETIYTIPRNQWSNTLWFRLISALNNKKECEKSREELEKIKPYCKTTSDMAKYYYMLGYSFYIEDAEITALDYFELCAKTDQSYADEIELQNDIEDCKKYIKDSLKKLNEVAKSIANAISTRINKTPQENKWQPSDDEFSLLLAFLPSIRADNKINTAMGLDDLFFKYQENEKPAIREWLNDFHDVTDKESLKKKFDKSFSRNEKYFIDLYNYLKGNPTFDLEELNDDGRFAFNSCLSYIEKIIDYLPEGGIAAWDLSERIGLARHAYGCDLLKNSEYTSCIIAMTDQAQELFSSWEEYLISLILGAGFFMYFITDFNIKEAINFMMTLIPILLGSSIMDAEWVETDSKK